MKKQNNNYLTGLGTTDVKRLTTIVAEKIALEIKQEVKKIFSAADLWNIQKQRRSFVQRMLAL